MGSLFGGGGGGGYAPVQQAPSADQLQAQQDANAKAAADAEAAKRSKGLFAMISNSGGPQGIPQAGGDFYLGTQRTNTLGGTT